MGNIQEYKCPCCGGAIVFDSAIQKMKCPCCDTEFEMEALAAGAVRVLSGEETAKEYTGIPVWNGFDLE